MNPAKAEELNKEVDKLLILGIIRHSEIPFASPCITVLKEDGTSRLVIDYRRVIQECVQQPAFPLPRIDDLIDRVGQSKYLTKLDISLLERRNASRFYSINGMGFSIWPLEIFTFTVLNLLRTSLFSRIINLMLKGLEKFASAYLDDITCHSGIYKEGELWKQHLNHIRQILLAIRKSDMKLNKAKCEFGKVVVDYLGVQIGLNFISPRLPNIEAMIKFPRPTTNRQL